LLQIKHLLTKLLNKNLNFFIFAAFRRKEIVVVLERGTLVHLDVQRLRRRSKRRVRRVAVSRNDGGMSQRLQRQRRMRSGEVSVSDRIWWRRL
jgi:hypothetical protein